MPTAQSFNNVPADAALGLLKQTHSALLCATMLLAAILPFSAPRIAHAEEAEQMTYYESFVLLRIGRSRGDSFYRVMMDDDETPYLEVTDILSHWLEFKKVECNPDRMYCQAVMLPSNKVFWLDGQEMQLGDSGERSKQKTLFQRDLILKEGKLWLKHDVFEKWLPLYSVWSLKYYSMALQPYYLTADQRKKERATNRKREIQRKKQAELLSQQTVFLPNHTPSVETRHQINLQKSTDEEGQSLHSQVDLSADIYRGNFLLSAQAAESELLSSSELSFWRYQKLNGEHYYLFDAGYTNSNSDLLISSFNLKNGVRIDQIKKHKGAGKFEHIGHTISGSEVDVYHNGFLIHSTVADSSGRYQIPATFSAGGDNFTLKFFHPDGSETNETIRIAPDNSKILKPKQWDHQLILGQLSQNAQQSYGQITSRYGLSQSISMGAHLVSLPHLSNDKNNPTIKLDLAWRIVDGINLLTESYVHPEGLDWSSQMDIVTFNRHNLQIILGFFSDQSPLLETPGVAGNSRKRGSFIHSMQLGRWRTLEAIRSSESETQLSWKLDRRINRLMNLSSQADYNQPVDGDNSYSMTLENTTDFSETLNLGVKLNSSESNYQASGLLRKKAAPGGKISFALGYSMSKVEDPLYSLNATWKIAKNVHSSISALNDTVVVNIGWRNIWASNIKHKPWQDFSTGSVEGIIMSPKDENGNRQPLEDVSIWAGSKKSLTNQNGRYQITGLPPDQKIQLRTDPNTLDATIAPIEKSRQVRLRSGSSYEYSPELTWTAGMDGVVFNRNILSIDAKIQVLDESGTPIQLVSLEEDGFFLAESLTPGKYTLVIVNGGLNTLPLEITIPENTDWLPAVEWHID